MNIDCLAKALTSEERSKPKAHEEPHQSSTHRQYSAFSGQNYHPDFSSQGKPVILLIYIWEWCQMNEAWKHYHAKNLTRDQNIIVLPNAELNKIEAPERRQKGNQTLIA
jgi:hypothetical protein